MQSLIIGTKALSVISGLSSELLIQTIKTTSTGIINTISYISTYNKVDLTYIKKDLDEFDLENKITIINKFIEEIENKKNIKESIKYSIISLHDVLEKINNEINKIKEDIEYHQTKYLNSWRSLDCSNKLEIIEKNNKLLDNRFEMLVKLLSVKFD